MTFPSKGKIVPERILSVPPKMAGNNLGVVMASADAEVTVVVLMRRNEDLPKVLTVTICGFFRFLQQPTEIGAFTADFTSVIGVEVRTDMPINERGDFCAGFAIGMLYLVDAIKRSDDEDCEHVLTQFSIRPDTIRRPKYGSNPFSLN